MSTTITVVVAEHDYKYESRLWRADVEETFQKTRDVHTDYTVVDGQIVKQVETTFSFASAIAESSPQTPEVPATFIFIDGTYRRDMAYIFQKTHIKTTTFEAYGDTAYLQTIDDYDVLTGVNTRTVSIVDGKIPLAPTVNSALTNLIQQPVTSVLDQNCDYIEGRVSIDNIWLEDGDDAATVAKRRMQRENAIVRRVKHAANPFMKIGDTVRLVDAKRGLDARHMLTGRTIVENESGGVDQVTELEFWQT